MNAQIKLVIAVTVSSVWTSIMPPAVKAAQTLSVAHEQNAEQHVELPLNRVRDLLYQAHKAWGCEVLLCLANPDGPTAVKECVPPIHRLRRALARGHPFPRCKLSNGQDSSAHGTWVQRGFNYYNRCPEGTTALALGQYAMHTNGGTNAWSTTVLYAGIGDGNGYSPFVGNPAGQPIVCVGNRTNIDRQTLKIADQWKSVVVDRYERIVLLHPTRQPRIFDVYVDNEISQRVRW